MWPLFLPKRCRKGLLVSRSHNQCGCFCMHQALTLLPWDCQMDCVCFSPTHVVDLCCWIKLWKTLDCFHLRGKSVNFMGCLIGLVHGLFSKAIIVPGQAMDSQFYLEHLRNKLILSLWKCTVMVQQYSARLFLVTQTIKNVLITWERKIYKLYLTNVNRENRI